MGVKNTGRSEHAAHNGVPPLDRLYFYLTEGCNLACRHCWLTPKFDVNGSRHSALPVELFETAIREAKPLGLSSVKLTGGEPLLHSQITTLLEIVRREELDLTIETNGMLCTAELAAEIAKSPQRFVSVSLDGADAATHDWVRNVPGSFERTKQGILNLVAADTPPQIIMSIMRANAGQVEAMVRLAEDLGAASVKFNIVQPTGRGETIHARTDGLGVVETIELGRTVDTDLATGTDLALHFDYPMAFRPLSRIAHGSGAGVCGIHGILGVIARGHYALCGIGEHMAAMVFGKVGDDRLDEVWRENVILNTLRAGVPDHLSGICSRCLMRRRCLGACVAQSYYRSGDLLAPYWFCERAEAAGLFPDTRLELATPCLEK